MPATATATSTRRIRLSREAVRRLVPDPRMLGTDTVQSGDTALCGPSRMSACDDGCEVTVA